MIYTRANLLVHRVAGGKDDAKQLRCVHLDEDGTTVASNGEVVLAVEPAPDGAYKGWPEGKVPLTGVDTPAGRNLPVKQAKKVLKHLPSAAKTGEKAQVAGLTRCGPNRVELTVLQKGGETREARKPRNLPYVDWREAIEQASLGEAASPKEGRICAGRRQLEELLDCIDRACGSKRADPVGPVFIEMVGGPIVVRAAHPITGQRMVGFVQPLKRAKGEWLDYSDWEESLLSVRSRASSAKKRRKRI